MFRVQGFGGLKALKVAAAFEKSPVLLYAPPPPPIPIVEAPHIEKAVCV